MTDLEFADFQRFLFARFPEIESWLSKIEQKAETIDAWYELLRHADLHFAKEAVSRLHAKLEPMPSWSFLPATIREIAARLEAEAQQPTAPTESLEAQRKRIPYTKPEDPRIGWARALQRAAEAGRGE